MRNRNCKSCSRGLPNKMFRFCVMRACEMHCLRSNGTERKWFRTREAAEKFGADPKNHPVYLLDVAHVCGTCGFRHLSRPEFFFFNDTATTEIYTLSLHDALPI